jgi:hypothetical protein
MAQSPQEFFSKNTKWIALILLFLLIITLIRNCNHNIGIRIAEKQYKYTIDSLNKKVDILSDTLKEKAFEIRGLRDRIGLENKRATDFQTIAEQATKRNTTIINNIQKDDTTKRK